MPTNCKKTPAGVDSNTLVNLAKATQSAKRQRLKLLALANGDSYPECDVDEPLSGLLAAVQEREFIKIYYGHREILVNSDYIVSIEL